MKELQYILQMCTLTGIDYLTEISTYSWLQDNLADFRWSSAIHRRRLSRRRRKISSGNSVFICRRIRRLLFSMVITCANQACWSSLLRSLFRILAWTVISGCDGRHWRSSSSPSTGRWRWKRCKPLTCSGSGARWMSRTLSSFCLPASPTQLFANMQSSDFSKPTTRHVADGFSIILSW